MGAGGNINDLIAAQQEQVREMQDPGMELAGAGVVFEDLSEWLAHEPTPFDWILQDVVAKGMKGDLIAKSKQWKSFFAMQLGLSVAAGMPFLGMKVPEARRVAYFNLELTERGAWERLVSMKKATGAEPDQGMFLLVNLRGNAGSLRAHPTALVEDVRRRGVDLVILDPRYKLIADGEDENTADGVRGVLEFRDALAEVAAVLMVGHDPKGDTAGKGIADRGAGADYDFAFALSPHESEGLSVLSTSCRDRQSPPDLTIKFDPKRVLFEARPDTPAAVRQIRRGSPDHNGKAGSSKANMDALKKVVGDYFTNHSLVGKRKFMMDIQSMPGCPLVGQGRFRDMISALIEDGVIAQTPEKVRNGAGEVKNRKNGLQLVGTKEMVMDYQSRFSASEGLPF